MGKHFSFESLGLLTVLLSNLEPHPPSLAVLVQELGLYVCCVLSQVLFHGPFEVTASFSHMGLRFTVLVLGAGF